MKTIKVTVVYALPNIQHFIVVCMNIGDTVKDSIIKSNITKFMENNSLYHLQVGIYNKKVSLNSKIKDGDRIEIYRNLIVDPKERRRKKVTQSKKSILK
ncbi:RnfH family protein [Buchnera aphidicola (Hyadaphis tataricae)]|uniref:UPF0125 protein D9V69_01260 n=1 Tax=Buchnera aphidicola (Hyadaphis tataricae) TaxID=1241859 RepID=A0A4D6XZH8_9GAMM|nr:RnfH family protein [Buchnera aphidicola]QCI21559.1 RnfH family protein [Buchnera aphidicola (Hyadaphis tataricae)]